MTRYRNYFIEQFTDNPELNLTRRPGQTAPHSPYSQLSSSPVCSELDSTSEKKRNNNDGNWKGKKKYGYVNVCNYVLVMV